MQKRPQNTTIALIVIGVIIAGLLLFALLTRGSSGGSLTGPTWQLSAITGQTPAFQGVIPAADQPRYTITFATDDTVAARADCNSIAGTYKLDRNDGITIIPGPSTLVACPEGSYGSLFAHSLGTVTTWAIADADLTLTTSDGGTGMFIDSATAPVVPPTAEPTASPAPSPSPTVEPTPSPTPSPSPTPTPTATPTASPTASGSAGPSTAPTAAPTPTPRPQSTPTPAPTATPVPGGDLVGTSWQITSFTTRDPVFAAVVSVTERFKYTISFAAGGTFAATADCNVVAGQWTATATGGLSIVPGPSTIVACAEGSYSDLYILALSNSASYTIANGALTVTLADGGTLGYEPLPAP